MKFEFLMPQLGESITEAKISKWRKKVGEFVNKEEPIVDISTDKVDSEVPSPVAGVITEILFAEGDTVAVKKVIANIDTSATQGATAPRKDEKVLPESAKSPAPLTPPSPSPSLTPTPVAEERSESTKSYTPVVISLAEKHGIGPAELEKVVGSGPRGKVTKEDLQSYIDSKSAPKAAAPAAPSAPAATKPAEKKDTSVPPGEWSPDGKKIVVMDGMRSAIAEHMVRSKHTSPHVYTVQECDVTKISKYRAKHKNAFQAQEGFSLSFTPFFLEAAVKALVAFPYVNASMEGKKIILHQHVNLGCAVALGTSGLIVPVIKKAEEKNFVGIARALNDIATRARNKKLLPDDVVGGTFSVTNPGIFGTLIGTPIINQPQAAILCLGAIEKRPVVIDDMIAIRERCYITLSYDHRIVDGSVSGQFLQKVREHIENWDENAPLR